MEFFIIFTKNSNERYSIRKPVRMHKILPLSLLIFLFTSQISFSQEETVEDLFDKPTTAKEKNIWNYFTYDMGNVFAGVGFAYSRPVHW